MIIINKEKLNEAGYTTNLKRTAIFPIERTSNTYSVLIQGFLVVVNCENLKADERTKKNKIKDLMHDLAKKSIIVYRQDELQF